jgi:hypothetical protein
MSARRRRQQKKLMTAPENSLSHKSLDIASKNGGRSEREREKLDARSLTWKDAGHHHPNE